MPISVQTASLTLIGMRAMDGPLGAQAPDNPGKTTFLPGLAAIKAMEGFDRNLV
jgi:hypothetical protein